MCCSPPDFPLSLPAFVWPLSEPPLFSSMAVVLGLGLHVGRRSSLLFLLPESNCSSSLFSDEALMAFAGEWRKRGKNQRRKKKRRRVGEMVYRPWRRRRRRLHWTDGMGGGGEARGFFFRYFFAGGKCWVIWPTSAGRAEVAFTQYFFPYPNLNW